MRDAARKAGRLLQVGLLCRSIATYRHIKEVADAGMHGRLLSLATWRLGSYLHPDAPDHKPHYGDPTTELMTFDLDFANWVMGGRRARRRPAGMTSPPCSTTATAATPRSLASGLMPPGTPFTVGFRALFEGACFELQQVFRDGPPEIAFTIAEAARRDLSTCPAAILTRSNCAASSTASPARPIPRCSTPTARSRRCVCRSPRSGSCPRPGPSRSKARMDYELKGRTCRSPAQAPASAPASCGCSADAGRQGRGRRPAGRPDRAPRRRHRRRGRRHERRRSRPHRHRSARSRSW